ncbi:MAG: leucine-rich repeat domain-containing protein [Muribaculum sp.]|nr:leucine-rich repeat domain-containing protein [Muribaculum sp.]
MKRFYPLVIVILVSINVMAYDFAVRNSAGNDIYYRITSVDKKNIEVTNNGYGCYEGGLEIPAFVDYDGVKKTVGGVGIKAFKDCEKLESVNLPVTVKYVDYKAFKDCINLIQIILPSSIDYLGYQCFAGCKRLFILWIAASDPSNVECENYGSPLKDFYINPECRIYVPKGSANLYKKSMSWNKYTIEECFMPR